jgi:hypothetical protein
MRTLEIEFTAIIKEIEFTHSFEFTDNESEDDVKEAICEAYNDQKEDDEVDITPDEVDIISNDCTDPEIDTNFDLYTYAEYYCNSNDHEIEVLKAAYNCGISATDVDEAYSGEYSDEAAFAEDMADQLGLTDNNQSWPLNCIDWDQAAKELMYDYCADSGHYFRNL